MVILLVMKIDSPVAHLNGRAISVLDVAPDCTNHDVGVSYVMAWKLYCFMSWL